MTRQRLPVARVGAVIVLELARGPEQLPLQFGDARIQPGERRLVLLLLLLHLAPQPPACGVLARPHRLLALHHLARQVVDLGRQRAPLVLVLLRLHPYHVVKLARLILVLVLQPDDAPVEVLSQVRKLRVQPRYLLLLPAEPVPVRGGLGLVVRDGPGAAVLRLPLLHPHLLVALALLLLPNHAPLLLPTEGGGRPPPRGADADDDAVGVLPDLVDQQLELRGTALEIRHLPPTPLVHEYVRELRGIQKAAHLLVVRVVVLHLGEAHATLGHHLAAAGLVVNVPELRSELAVPGVEDLARLAPRGVHLDCIFFILEARWDVVCVDGGG